MMIEQNTNYAYKLKYLDNPSFDKVRDLAVNFYMELPKPLQEELYDALNRGVEILDSEPLMLAYLHAFGLMHQAKLNYAFNHLPDEFLKQPEISIIDYGCGQALGTMCYIDYLKSKNINQRIKRVTLIEPSELCLKRAALHISAFCPDAQIVTINESFDELNDDEYSIPENSAILHILSNVLDILDFNLDRFISCIKSQLQGYNQFICVSPYFSIFDRDNRMCQFAKALCNNYTDIILNKGELSDNKDWTCHICCFTLKPLSSKEKEVIAEKYNTQAAKLIWYDGLHLTNSRDDVSKAEQLYKKATELGNINAMWQLYINNSGRFREDYETALFWLKKIEDNLKQHKKTLSKQLIEDFIRTYKHLNKKELVAKYEKLLDKAIVDERNRIKNDAKNSDVDYYTHAHSILWGDYGLEKDEDKAFELIEDDVKNGNRQLYEMYYKLLKKKGDPAYFYYLIESLKDNEKQLSDEYIKNLKKYDSNIAKELYDEHKRRWLTKYYTDIALAYMEGFGVIKDVDAAITYLHKALSCNDYDKESVTLYSRIRNGEYGEKYIDYKETQKVLNRLYLDSKDNNNLYALLGDAYFGESITNFFKARYYYNKCNEIRSYNSKIRQKYRITKGVIISLFIVLIGLIIL